MINLLLPLMAVSLTPHYTYNYNNSLQESVIYDMTYNISDDSFALGERPENVSPNMRYNVFTLMFDELLVSNYEVSIQAELKFNPTLVAEFGSCSLVLYYDDDPIISAAFGPTFFNFRTNDFSYDYNVMTNKYWSSHLEYSGSDTLYFSLSEEEIEQDELTLAFFAYEENSTKAHYDAIEQGYNDGYKSGYDVGLQEGRQETPTGALNWLGNMFNSIGGIFNIEIFPNVKLIYVIGIPVAVAVLAFVLKALIN